MNLKSVSTSVFTHNTPHKAGVPLLSAYGERLYPGRSSQRFEDTCNTLVVIDDCPRAELITGPMLARGLDDRE